MKIIDGWEYKELKKRDSKILTLGHNRRFEKFTLGSVNCFTWLADPNSIWASYGETYDFGQLFDYFDDCVKFSGYDFKIPTPKDLSFMVENYGFVSYRNTLNVNFTLNDIWHSENVDDGVRRSMFFLLKVEDL